MPSIVSTSLFMTYFSIDYQSPSKVNLDGHKKSAAIISRTNAKNSVNAEPNGGPNTLL